MNALYAHLFSQKLVLDILEEKSFLLVRYLR